MELITHKLPLHFFVPVIVAPDRSTPLHSRPCESMRSSRTLLPLDSSTAAFLTSLFQIRNISSAAASMASQARKDKEKFFADLYALDDLAGEDDEVSPHPKVKSRKPEHDARRGSRSSGQRSARAADISGSRLDSGVNESQEQASVDRARGVAKQVRGDGRSQERMPPLPRLYASETTPESNTLPSLEPAEPKPGLRRTQTEDAAPRASKKARKKGPEVPQIFAGQTFFFVPNDNRAVPRKRRIDKAVLHGATWARAWVPGVTHIIVESSKKLEDVVKLTGQDEIPAHIALVWDTWLTESLGYKEARDSSARRFRVRVEHPIETPKSGRERARDSHQQEDGNSSEGPTEDLHMRPRDALDDLYEEARATQYLID